MRTWTVGLVVMMVLGDSLDAYALDGHRRITQYAQTHFTARDGMPHNYAAAIAQTSDGYLWTASQEGLSRFDGAGFTNFDTRKTEGIPVNRFTALAVDPAGTLWAGTYDHGVLHVVDGTFAAVAWEPGPQKQMVRALAFDASGDLWIGMRDRGVVRLHAGKLVAALTTQDGLPSDDIRSFLRTDDGAMWIGTFKGLARWKAGQITRGPALLEGTVIYSIAQDAEGDVWCGTENGLAQIHGNTVELMDSAGFPARDVHAVRFDHDHNLWLGTSAGVVRRTPDGQIQHLPQPDGGINALFEDREGNLWIGSDKGLDRLFDGDMIPVGSTEGLTDEPARGVREDVTGALWVTTNVGLFEIPLGESLATKVTAADRGVLFTIYPDSHGDVWFGGRGDVGRWHAGRFTWLGHQRWERIRSFAETPDGMWVGTQRGVYQLQGDRLDDARLVVPDVAVGAMVPDRAGSLWLATAGAGLMRWSNGGPAPVPPNGPPRSWPVSTILFDPDGTMWVGTTGAGLWRLHDGDWTAFTTKDGMFDDLIWSTLDDGLGNFWMSSNRGVWRVSRRQLEDRAAGLRPTIESVVYGEADGMRDRECNGAQDPAGWRARDGRLWFPTGKGLVVIDPAHLHASQPPNALIASIRVDGELRAPGRELVLRPGTSRLELAYTAPALRAPVRLRFRYRLDGFEPDWNDAGTQRVARYTSLPPGEYRFVVEAGLDDQWGSADSIAVTLPPRFYQTGWFYALALLSIAVATVAVPLMRMRRLRARAHELDQRVQDAIRELKVLSGLLPICGWCKKIREDRGCWRKIEAYLSAHTDARFAHGICPECTDKMLIEETFGSVTGREAHSR
jgi:ligand-binding sensor domain-containing protein